VDVLVVIPSYNSAPTIGYVVYQAARGVEEHFEGRGLILVSDGGSRDGTLGVVEALKAGLGVKVEAQRYSGPPGKGSAVLHGFRKAVNEGFSAVIMLDSDLRSVEPYWIALLGRAAQGYGLVTPLYVRHKHDGTITKTLAYPVVAGLMGTPVRQPIGGDFGVSRRLAEAVLGRAESFAPAAYRFGIDFLITSTAVAERLPIAQADLGSKIHAPKDPAKHLRGMFLDVAETVVKALLSYYRPGMRGAPVEELRIAETWKCPQPVGVDVEAGVARFLEELRSSRMEVKKVFGEDEWLAEVAERLRKRAQEAFPDEKWAWAVLTTVTTYPRLGGVALKALYTAWLGKVVSYILDTMDATNEEAEKYVEKIVYSFKAQRALLEEVARE